jgi:hypothetical protein
VNQVIQAARKPPFLFHRWICTIGWQWSAAVVTDHLVPTEALSAGAGPSLGLFGQPGFGAFFGQILQFFQNIAVVNSAVILKSLDPLAGKFGTKSTVQDAFPICTVPDSALGAAGMDVEDSRAASLAGIAFRAAATPGSFGKQALMLVERCPVMVTGAAVQPKRFFQTL